MRRGRRRSSNSALAPSPVRVAVRVRPATTPTVERAADVPLPQQQRATHPPCVLVGADENTLQCNRDHGSKTFTCVGTHGLQPTVTAKLTVLAELVDTRFDHVFSPESTQKDVYATSLQPLLTSFLNGFNVTVLAYGQTGSGKTYTVGNKTSCTPAGSPVRPEDREGSDRDKKEPRAHRLGEEDGLLPRFLCDVFAALRQEPSVKTLHVSFLEIYCDELRDLLQARSNSHHHTGKDSHLTIREDEHKVWVENLRQLQAENVQKALELLNLGRSRQVVSANAINNTSSRSHAIYTMEVARKFVNEIKKTKLTFVDLAGSERTKKTQVEGLQMKESIQINVGLSALGHVINALGDDMSQKRRNSSDGADTAAPFVPYRSSKLTRLLRDSLGGNSMTLFIACVSPLKDHSEETFSTLQYANRARNIQNKVEKNVESLDSGGSPRGTGASEKRLQRTASEIEITLLQEQICYLKQQLDMAAAAATAAAATAAATVGASIPSLDERSAMFLHKCASFRDTERASSTCRGDDSNSTAVEMLPPVIPVTRVSKIKPPSRSKTMSPKHASQAAKLAVHGNRLAAQPSRIGSESPHYGLREGETAASQQANASVVSPNSSMDVSSALGDEVSDPRSNSVATPMQESSAEPLRSSDSFAAEEDVTLDVALQIGGSTGDVPDVQGYLLDVVDIFVLKETKSSEHPQMAPEQEDQRDLTDAYADYPIAPNPVAEDSHDGTVCTPQEAISESVMPLVTSGVPREQACARIVLDERKDIEDDEACGSELTASETHSDHTLTPSATSTTDHANEVHGDENRTSSLGDQDTHCGQSPDTRVPELFESDVPAESSSNERELGLATSPSADTTRALGEDFQAKARSELLTSTPEEALPSQSTVNDNDDRSVDLNASGSDGNAVVEASDHQPEVSVAGEDQENWSPVSPVSQDSAPSASTRSLASLVLRREPTSCSLYSSPDPECSPVHRATAATVALVTASDPVEISEHESANWVQPTSERAPFSDNQVGDQSEAPESCEASTATKIGASSAGLEETSEPDFVLDRLAPVSAHDSRHHRHRMSPSKRAVRPMTVFDFDDSWAKLQQSRPSSLGRLDTLIKATKQIMVEDFGARSNQDEGEERQSKCPATPTIDECLQTMAQYVEKRRRSRLRRAELKQKLRCFQKVLGLPRPLYDEDELRVFVSTHQESVLQQLVDFCEAVVAQRVFKRLRSWREAQVDNCFVSSTLERIFLARDQYAVCEEWLESKLHDRPYFQQHVLPLVLNGWIAVTPLELETEDAWLAL